ncbi:TAM41 [Candida pseudojiufengensis]|uniref:TAM41 n=1 Tax=Candida pseudojiufengensis TaxID=497109 RepID=UPI002225AD05|nr:TAM41 [Candida pseudojiufengensis]KAI5964059.1 TAM41 [Candida pseudojiufengensis]
MIKYWIRSFHVSIRKYTFVSTTTPYSDKYYRPIITEGAAGFDKLIIPKDFCADNQNLISENDLQNQLVDIVDTFKSPIDSSIGYGSGIIPQDGYELKEEKQLDFIFLVKDSRIFHQENLKQNPNHYSTSSTWLINLIQGKNGIYFNPYITVKEKIIKYGIVTKRSALMDLSEWSSLYFAGRLQKPVNYIKDNDIMLKFLNQYNLKNAMTIAIFLIKTNQFTEKQLYEQITSLSYLGDFRMIVGGENPNKAKNIVTKQFDNFKKLYDPILQFFIHKNYLVITDNDEKNRTFKTNLNINSRIKLISCLPLHFRTQLYSKYPESSIKDIAKDSNLPNNIKNLIARTITYSSILQTIKGVLTAGIFKSIKYALAKKSKSKPTN